MNFHLYKEEYTIHSEKFTAIVDFENDIGWIIFRNGGNIEFLLEEYEKFEGNMLDFVKSKVLKKRG